MEQSMSSLKSFAGIIPSPPIVYTDHHCTTVDFDAYREHLDFLLRHDVSALCVGGHAGETECLRDKERQGVIKVALEATKGRVPVIGGVVADSTWSAIEQVQWQKEAGADGVLVCPPNIVGWDAATADAMLVAHFKAIDEQGLPFIVYGGPGDGSSCRQLPPTMEKTARECVNLVGWKLAVRGITTGENSFADCVSALQRAEQATGRHVAPLVAGDANLLGALQAGAEGTINACESVRVDANCALFNAFKSGDIATATAIHDRHQKLGATIYGIRLGRSFTYFHYRFKIASWMLGYIKSPYMRLPQVPPPAEEIDMLHAALIETGMTPVHSAEEFWVPLSGGFNVAAE
jgi:4-hydroxy-tetrahydrodipicolinate synthase